MSLWKTLLLEAAENQGYAKGHRDGYATGRVQGREEGIEIARKQIAKALQREGLALASIANITNLPIAVLESLLLDQIAQ